MDVDHNGVIHYAEFAAALAVDDIEQTMQEKLAKRDKYGHIMLQHDSVLDRENYNIYEAAPH